MKNTLLLRFLFGQLSFFQNLKIGLLWAFLVFLSFDGMSQAINMGNTSTAVCTGTFYDNGGTGNYSLTNLTHTLTPGASGGKISAAFSGNLTFGTFGSTAPTLTVYNGPTTTSPIIGSWTTGQNPGTLTSTDATGALTFQFNYGTATSTSSGWVAAISQQNAATSISYVGGPFCQTGTANVTRSGVAGGTYSAAPAGLSINTTTGAVNLAASSPGTYTVTYTYASGTGCTPVTGSITINATPPIPDAGPDVSGLCTAALNSSSQPTGATVLFQENFDGNNGAVVTNTQVGTSAVAGHKWQYYNTTSSVTQFWISDATNGYACAISGNSLVMNDTYGHKCDYAWDDNMDRVVYCNSLVNAIGYSNLSLIFDYRTGGETNFDWMEIAYSTNGTSWTYLGTRYTNVSATGASVALPAALNNSNFYIGFRWVNDGNSGTSPGMVLDNISIVSTNTNTYSWTGPAGATFSPNNTVLNPTVNVSGTYTLSVSNGSCSTSDQAIVTISGVPAQPSAISGGGSVCSSTARTFSVTNVSGVTYTWSYSGTGTISGSGSSITLSATTGGTLTVTPSNACGNGTARTLAISVAALPVATMTASSTNVCYGNDFTLGGNVTASGGWTLTLSNGNTVSGTGNGSWSRVVTPTTTTTYTISSLTDASCAATSLTGSATLILPTVTTDLSGTESATCRVNGSNWVHFYNTTTGRLIVSIRPNGNDLGNVTASAFVDGSAVMTQACGTSHPMFTTAALGRRWAITPTVQPVTPVDIRLPFTTTEFSALQAAALTTTSNPLDDVNTIADLKLSKYSGVNQNGNAADNCIQAGGSGGTVFIPTQAGNGAVNTANGFMGTVASSNYLQFSISGFSEFWVHNAGNSSPLPVTLTHFSVNCNSQDKTDITWSTASEHNSAKFLVEKSRDMHNWISVSETPAAGNSNYMIDYADEDANPFGGISYYRLVQLDNDGTEKIYGPVSVSCSAAFGSMTVFPNPSKGVFTVEIASAENLGNADIRIADLTGKIVSSRQVQITAGKNQMLFEGMDLQPGTYIVWLVTDGENQFKPVKIAVNQ